MLPLINADYQDTYWTSYITNVNHLQYFQLGEIFEPWQALKFVTGGKAKIIYRMKKKSIKIEFEILGKVLVLSE